MLELVSDLMIYPHVLLPIKLRVYHLLPSSIVSRRPVSQTNADLLAVEDPAEPVKLMSNAQQPV